MDVHISTCGCGCLPPPPFALLLPIAWSLQFCPVSSFQSKAKAFPLEIVLSPNGFPLVPFMENVLGFRFLKNHTKKPNNPSS